MDVSEDFSLFSPLTSSAFESQERQFSKEKSKNLSIVQGKDLIIKIHESVLEEDFDPTLKLFSEGLLNIPPIIDVWVDRKVWQILVQYFYFHEVQPLSLDETLNLMKAAIFLKVDSLVDKISDYLSNQLYSAEKILPILRNGLEFLLFDSDKEFEEKIGQLIIHSSIPLLQLQKYDCFLEIFEQPFMKTMTNTLEYIFDLMIKRVFKNFKLPCEFLVSFVSIFKNPIISIKERQDPLFSKEKYFRDLLEVDLGFDSDAVPAIMKNLKITERKMDYLEEIQSLTSQVEQGYKRIQKLEENVAFLLKENKLNKEFSENKVFILENQLSEILHELNHFKTKFDENDKKMLNFSRLQFEPAKEKQTFERPPFQKIYEEKKSNPPTEEKNNESQYYKLIDDRLELVFDSNSSTRKHFYFSNNNRTCEKEGSDYRCGIKCKELDCKSNNLVFTIRIDHTKSSYLHLGFCYRQATPEKGYFRSDMAVMIDLMDGNLYEWGKHSKKVKKHFEIAKKSDQISVTLIQTNMVRLKLERNRKFEAEFNITLKKDHGPLIPCVDFFHKGDKITILKSEN